MPSLKKFREMTGLPDTVRRWNVAVEIVKKGQKMIADQKAVQVLLKGPPMTTEDHVHDIKVQDSAPVTQVKAVNLTGNSTWPSTEVLESIKRDGVNYESVERMHEWYPETAKHSDAIPLANMLEALGFESFTEHGTLWIERIDKVSNGYYLFEREENAYDMFLIPMPEGWGVIRDHLPKDMQMDALVGKLEDVLKYDVHERHIAPLEDINRVVAEHEAPGTISYSGPSQEEIMRRHREDIRERKG